MSGGAGIVYLVCKSAVPAPFDYCSRYLNVLLAILSDFCADAKSLSLVVVGRKGEGARMNVQRKGYVQ